MVDVSEEELEPYVLEIALDTSKWDAAVRDMLIAENKHLRVLVKRLRDKCNELYAQVDDFTQPPRTPEPP